jgi:hypothetical protein
VKLKINEMYFMFMSYVHFDACVLPLLSCELRLKICIALLNQKTLSSSATVGAVELASSS